MPLKRRIRNAAAREVKPRGFIQGKAPHREHNAHKVLRKWPYFRAALLWIVAMAILFLTAATFSYGILEKQKEFIYLGIAMFGFWVFIRLMYFFACTATTCPLCHASHFTDGKSSKHRKAFKVFPLSYSSTALCTAILVRCVRCMHCGVTFDLNKKYR